MRPARTGVNVLLQEQMSSFRSHWLNGLDAGTSHGDDRNEQPEGFALGAHDGMMKLCFQQTANRKRKPASSQHIREAHVPAYDHTLKRSGVQN